MSVLPPGYISAIISITRSGDPDPYAVTWAFDGTPESIGDPDLADAVQANFIVNWASSFPNDCVLGPTTLRIGQDGGDPILLTSTTTGTGSNSSDFLPQNTAVLLQKRSAFGGRKNRGRMFMPIATETTVSEVGAITPAQQASYQNIANEWLTGYNNDVTGFGQMVILHNDATTPTPVTALTVSGLIATQRRRLRR